MAGGLVVRVLQPWQENLGRRQVKSPKVYISDPGLLHALRGTRRLGFEIKRTTSPSTTRSMHSALEPLGLERLDVIHAGEHTFALRERIRAVAFGRLDQDIEPLV